MAPITERVAITEDMQAECRTLMYAYYAYHQHVDQMAQRYDLSPEFIHAEVADAYTTDKTERKRARAHIVATWLLDQLRALGWRIE